MNLQLVSPYKRCPYKCPFCIAAVNDDSYYDDYLYFNHPSIYFNRLLRALDVNNIDTVVITGATEPTLFEKWINEVVGCIMRNQGRHPVKIEIQTRNYHYKGDKNFDIVAYSYDRVPAVLPKAHTNTRHVFINNKHLDIKKLIALRQSGCIDQMTVKQMQKTSHDTTDVDKYIASVYEEVTAEEIRLMEQYNIWFDFNCMASEGRYIIYRCDGNVYQTWGEPPRKKLGNLIPQG